MRQSSFSTSSVTFSPALKTLGRKIRKRPRASVVSRSPVCFMITVTLILGNSGELFAIPANMESLPRVASIPAPTARRGQVPRAAQRTQRTGALLFPLHGEVERGIAQGGICPIRDITIFASDELDRSLRHGLELQRKNAMP